MNEYLKAQNKTNEIIIANNFTGNEFGKNYKPEMSYEHRGLVIGVKQKLLYVLPIFSYDPAKHPDVYHLADNPAYI